MFKLFAFVVALLLAMQTSAAADQPLQLRRHVDADVRGNVASAICGFEIRVHIVGDATIKLFYDKNGNIVREVDTFPSYKVTVYRPGTDQAYTSASPQLLHFYYTKGAALNSAVTVVGTGLLEKIPGVGMDSGRVVIEAKVIGYDADGVPLTEFVREISSSGPDLPLQPFGRNRCAYFQQ
jgi:hypothetical protein